MGGGKVRNANSAKREFRDRTRICQSELRQYIGVFRFLFIGKLVDDFIGKLVDDPLNATNPGI